VQIGERFESVLGAEDPEGLPVMYALIDAPASASLEAGEYNVRGGTAGSLLLSRWESSEL
jgi:hypothetical protein